MSKQKLTQVVALGALACSTFSLSTSVIAAAPSAALSGVDSSTIINSAAVSQNQNNSGLATGKSQAGIGFEDGNLWLISAPNLNFGTRIIQVYKVWNLVPNKSESSDGSNKQDDYKNDSIVVGDFRSPRDSNGELNNVKNGWTLTVQVSDFRLKTPDRPDGDPDNIQPIAYMNFNSARLLHGNFKGPITEDAIKNKQFDLKAATNGYPGAPTNNIVGTDSDTKSISIVPEQPGTTIWSAQSDSIQGKSIWGLAFNDEKDVELDTLSRESQITGDYVAKLTWTLSTIPVA
ncbi:WxL domain-containing protein [Bombilactobacillus mellis]|uniref:WxL domain-containing protein n=1 Tax=Bombilactobacillus mellis TaxID=1218508 RepID=UPI00157FF84D|nr:WxL domain-containing protein [Bombilactobacillus mellis]NUF25942.1 hypothetical protein [Bombilactobacillus mellis]